MDRAAAVGVPEGNRLRRRAAACSLALSAGALGVLRLAWVPDQPALRLCLFHWLTGRPCPLCGLTRSLFAAAHGRWSAAFHWHPFGPLLLGALILCALWNLAALIRPTLRFPALTPGARALAWRLPAAALAGFGLVRMFTGPFV